MVRLVRVIEEVIGARGKTSFRPQTPANHHQEKNSLHHHAPQQRPIILHQILAHHPQILPSLPLRLAQIQARALALALLVQQPQAVPQILDICPQCVRLEIGPGPARSGAPSAAPPPKQLQLQPPPSPALLSPPLRRKSQGNSTWPTHPTTEKIPLRQMPQRCPILDRQVPAHEPPTGPATPAPPPAPPPNHRPRPPAGASTRLRPGASPTTGSVRDPPRQQPHRSRVASLPCRPPGTSRAPQAASSLSVRR